MTDRRIRLCASAAILIVSACAPTPQILKRYDTADYTDTAHGTKLSVSTFAVEPAETPASAPKLSSLSDHGQAAFIEAAAAKGKDIDDLKAAVTKPFASPPAQESLLDESRMTFTKRLVITLRKSEFRPADRLSEATVIVKLPPRVKILAWERLENDYMKVDQGELSLQQGNKFDVSTGITIPGASFLKPIDVSAEKTNTLSEKQQLVTSFIRFAGELTDQTVTLYQQADTQIDIGGTVAANLKLTFVPGPEDKWIGQEYYWEFKNLTAGGKPSLPAAVNVAMKAVRFPRCKGDLKPLSVDASYTVRVVDRGDATINEGDDAVTFTRGFSQASPEAIGVLVQAQEKSFDYFRIYHPDEKYLMIIDPGGADPTGTDLKFNSYEEAAAFLSWLRLSPAAPKGVGRWKLATSESNLPPSKKIIADLEVRRGLANEEEDAGECSAPGEQP